MKIRNLIFSIFCTILPQLTLAQSSDFQIPNLSPEAETKRLADIKASEIVLNLERNMADEIYQNGIYQTYLNYISPEGILYDSTGGSPKGISGIEVRFKNFPSDVKFVRIVKKAESAEKFATTWGEYSIIRGETILAMGQFMTVWEETDAGWKIIAELAAGRDAPKTLPPKPHIPLSQPNPTAPVLRDALGRPVN